MEIKTAGDRLRIEFDAFNIDAYRLFLKVKRLPEYHLEFDRDRDCYIVTAPARFASILGIPVPQAIAGDLPFASCLLDDQLAITSMALDAKRFADWSDCGQGKTLVGLEFSRHIIHRTHGRVLIVTLNEIVPQWIEESKKFYADTLPIVRLESREEMKRWCKDGSGSLAITNYEKFNHLTESDQVVNEIRHLAGIVLDESSRLKSGGGSQKWAIIKSARGVEYKLSLTATPAPNEIMEFASQASFLEKLRDENEIIWTYFRRDEKTHRWTVKKHARKAFFEFMAAWSIYVRDPRQYGWRLNVPQPPDPQYFITEIPMTAAQRQIVMDYNADPRHVPAAMAGTMFVGEMSAIAANKLSQAAKGFVYVVKTETREVKPVESLKPPAIAKLIEAESKLDEPGGVLVWTIFDEEIEILSRLLSKRSLSFETITGRTKTADRAAILDRFRQGKTRILLSRAEMLGYGMNFQHCYSMVFSGWSFSYENFYQAVRRAHRHGQTRSVRIHIPIIPEMEGQMWEAIGRKRRQHEEAVAEMEANYIAARNRVLTAENERGAA